MISQQLFFSGIKTLGIFFFCIMVSSHLQAQVKTKKPTTSKPSNKTVVYSEIEPLLIKNTCLSCHTLDTRLVGPPYKEVAQRNYPVAKIIDLIYNPNPEHWPGYPPMSAMPQVPQEDARKIANWIKTLK